MVDSGNDMAISYPDPAAALGRRMRDSGNETARKIFRRMTTTARRPRERPRSIGDFDVLEDGSLYFRKMDVDCSSCGALHFIVERKRGSSMGRPAFSNCCTNGCIASEIVPRFSDAPILLKQLLTESSTNATSFRKNIRKYNSALVMASVTCNWVAPSFGNSAFNSTLTIQGRLHYFVGPLNPTEGLRPKYLSVYIHESLDNENDRAGHGEEDFPGTIMADLTQLQSMLPVQNSLVQSFVSLRELSVLNATPINVQLIIQADRLPINRHERRYNAPVASEVAAIVVGSDPDYIHPNDIVLRRRGVLNSNGNETLQSISVSHRKYNA